MSQALYRKWRPAQWDEVIGQQHVVQTLRNAITADRVAHAFLFAGPRGTGKTTTARLLAKAVNCLEPELAKRPCNTCLHCQAVNQGRFMDLIEIDAASNTSVEDVRDLRDKINFSPNQARFKVYIVDEVHMLSTAAFNALLKTLEEPPSHAIFILATTEVHKIPATVLSRCQRHEFRRIPVSEIVSTLKTLAESEGIQVQPEALTLVARQATGSMRDAISLLDQLASSGQLVTLEMAQAVLGTATSQAVLDLLEAVIANQPAEGLEVLHRTLDAGSDPRQFARQVVDYLRGLLLVAMGNANQVDATAEVRAQMARHSQALPVPELLRLIQAFNQAANEGRGGWQPALPLEMAFVGALTPPAPAAAAAAAAAPPSAAPARLAAHEKRPPATPHPAPAKAAPDEPPPPETLTPEDASANQRLEENWRKLLAAVRQANPQVYGLLNSSRAHLVKGSILILGYPSDILKSQVEKAHNIEVIQAAVKEVLGLEVSVRCFIVSGKRSTPPPDVDTDGMVAAALRDLGGEIVDVQ